MILLEAPNVALVSKIPTLHRYTFHHNSKHQHIFMISDFNENPVISAGWGRSPQNANDEKTRTNLLYANVKIPDDVKPGQQTFNMPSSPGAFYVVFAFLHYSSLAFSTLFYCSALHVIYSTIYYNSTNIPVGRVTKVLD